MNDEHNRIYKLKILNDRSNDYIKTHAKSSKFKYKGVYEKLQMIYSTNPKFELIVEILLNQEQIIQTLQEKINHLEKIKTD